MNLKKKVTTLALMGAMAVASASAANIGVVNMAQVYNSYPGFGAINMQVKKVQDTYNVQIEKEMKNIEKMSDKTKQEAAYNQKVVPLVKKAEEEIGKIVAPMDKAIFDKIEEVRAEKKLDVIVSNPNAVLATSKDSQGAVVTDDVIAKLK